MLVGHRPAFADLEPDRMWSTYRRYHLMIVGQRDDEKAIALARAVVAVLAGSLPTSRALLARAADTRRVGVLIATNQQDVAILAVDSAESLCSWQVALRRCPQCVVERHCLIRQPRPCVPARLPGSQRLPLGADAGRAQRRTTHTRQCPWGNRAGAPRISCLFRRRPAAQRLTTWPRRARLAQASRRRSAATRPWAK